MNSNCFFGKSLHMGTKVCIWEPKFAHWGPKFVYGDQSLHMGINVCVWGPVCAWILKFELHIKPSGEPYLSLKLVLDIGELNVELINSLECPVDFLLQLQSVLATAAGGTLPLGLPSQHVPHQAPQLPHHCSQHAVLMNTRITRVRSSV